MDSPAHPAHHDRLLVLRRIDQKWATAVYEASQRVPDHAGRIIFDIPRSEWLPEYWAGLEQIAENIKVLAEILDDIGWPGNPQVGEEAAEAAWLVAQHAGEVDVTFQERCLTLMTDRAREGDVDTNQLAALADRVELHAGRPQLYGTHLEADGAGSFRAVRGNGDAAALDARRAAIGLTPWAEYFADCLAGKPTRPVFLSA